MRECKSKFVFVILQYGAYSVTKKCVESILKFCDASASIVIVDNNSPDDSYARAVKDFEQNKQINIIKSDTNLGFAKGNNLGLDYAYNNLNPDFAVVLNNDTEILDDSFQFLVEQEYAQSHFYAMGPMILSGDGRYTSTPIRKKAWTASEINKSIRNESFFLKLSKIKLGFLYWAFIALKRKSKKKIKFEKANFLERQEDVELHGSFLIFSKDFLNEFKGFDSRTFMYCEEPILFHKLLKNKKKTVYNPAVKIYHAEDASTNSAYGKSTAKQIFYLKNHIDSCKVLLEVMEEA